MRSKRVDLEADPRLGLNRPESVLDPQTRAHLSGIMCG
jgi:hypothetical protein